MSWRRALLRVQVRTALYLTTDLVNEGVFGPILPEGVRLEAFSEDPGEDPGVALAVRCSVSSIRIPCETQCRSDA